MVLFPGHLHRERVGVVMVTLDLLRFAPAQIFEAIFHTQLDDIVRPPRSFEDQVHNVEVLLANLDVSVPFDLLLLFSSVSCARLNPFVFRTRRVDHCRSPRVAGW